MDYIAVHFEITPFSEENAEILEAEVSDLGFDSYTVEEPCLNAFIPKDNFSQMALKAVASGFGGYGFDVRYTTELIAEQNWNSVWESDFEPVVVDELVTVKAVYHKNLPKTKYNITIDPKMSFGSGHHQTTYMMIEAMLNDRRCVRGKRVLDMGCGTGILAIAASRLGAVAPIHAVDIDATCVRSTQGNARRNRVGHKIIVVRGDASVLQGGQYDTIFANINRNILVNDMHSYARALKPEGGQIFVSGFYTADIPVVEASAEIYGLKLEYMKERDGWALVKFKK